jgi:hypothetical protein
LTGLLALTAPAVAQETEQPPADYDRFIALEPGARREAFHQLPPADKAGIKRTHAERWLAANRPSLSPKGIAAMERAIAFVTPDLYQNQDPTAEQREEERAIGRGLACSIGPERASEAFALWPPGLKDERTRITKLVDSWFTWFENCVIG